MARFSSGSSDNRLAGLEVSEGRIEVDVTSLTSFAATLREELITNFLPYSDHIGQLAGPPRPPGHCPWGVAAAELAGDVARVDAHLDACMQILNQVLSGGAWLADSAELIAGQYRDSDAYLQAGVADLLFAPVAETARVPRERGYE